MIYQYTIGLIESFLKIIFTILNGISDSYFLSLILLAVIVRLATKPLEKYANRAVASQAEIDSVLTPQIDVIKGKYTGAERHNVIKRLYARYSYHPFFAVRSLSGILVQLPFFLAAYFMISNYSKLDGVVIPLLGDLGKPDSLLFGGFHLMPFVMTLVNVLSLVTMPKFNRKSLIQGLFISLMFLVLLYESPLALLIYWTTSNLISLISNFAPTISEKFKFNKPKKKFKNTFIGRSFEEYGYLFFITNLAISIPLLGVLGEQFNFFTAHSLSSSFIISMLLIIGIVPALILSIFRWASKIFGFLKIFNVTVLFIFLGLFLFYSLNKAGYGFFPTKYEPYILFILTLVLTTIAVVLVLKEKRLRNLSYLSLIIPLIFLNFIFASPASSLFKQSDTDEILFPEIKAINDTPVFLLIFDEFSGLTLQNLKGELDKSRYPGFADLASQADYFPNALTTCKWTSIAIPSILSGNLRKKHNKKSGLAIDNNLIDFFTSRTTVYAQSTALAANLMSPKDIDLNSFLSDFVTLYVHIINHKDWIEKRIGSIPQAWKDFGVFFKSNKDKQSKNHKNKHLKGFVNWMQNEKDTESINQFNFLHVQFPHYYYNTTSLGRFVKNDVPIIQNFLNDKQFVTNLNQTHLNIAYHNYMQQSAYTDILLQEFIKLLKTKNLYDKSLIVVTSDHGVNYSKKGKGRRFPYNEHSWKNIVSVPLFVKYPYQKRGLVNSSYVTILDISTTILKVVGIDSPWKSIGQNLKGIANNIQTKSVKLTLKYDEYFKRIKGLFKSSRVRKMNLFSESTPVNTIAVNYTEVPVYNSLLMKNISEFTNEAPSTLYAVFNSILNPQEVSHFGDIYQGLQLANNKIIAVVKDGKIQSVFKSGKVGDKNGYFTFSLPEKKTVAAEFNIALYEINSVNPFVLRKIKITNKNKLFKEEFQSKKINSFNWKNSVLSSNGLDTLDITNEGIESTSSNNNDPYIVFKSISKNAISEPVFHINIESNRDLNLQLYYQTKHNPKFNRSQSVSYKINKGTNSIYIKIPQKDVLGRFRIDLGNKKLSTEVVIKDIEIRI